MSIHSPVQRWQGPAGHPGGRQDPTLGSRKLPVPAPDTAVGASVGSPGLRRMRKDLELAREKNEGATKMSIEGPENIGTGLDT